MDGVRIALLVWCLMKKLVFLAAVAAVCFFSSTADAQGLRRFAAPQTCTTGNCPYSQPSPAATPLRSVAAAPIHFVQSASQNVGARFQTASRSTPSGTAGCSGAGSGWYLGKNLDRVFGEDRPRLIRR